jgi:hypothetical protein
MDICMILTPYHIRQFIITSSLTILLGLGAVGQVTIREKIAISPTAKKPTDNNPTPHALRFVFQTDQPILSSLRITLPCASSDFVVNGIDGAGYVEWSNSNALAGSYIIDPQNQVAELTQNSTNSFAIYCDGILVYQEDPWTSYAMGTSQFDSHPIEYSTPFYSNLIFTSSNNLVNAPDFVLFSITPSYDPNCIAGGWIPSQDSVTISILTGLQAGQLMLNNQLVGESATVLASDILNVSFIPADTLPGEEEQTVELSASSGGVISIVSFDVKENSDFCTLVSLIPDTLGAGDTAIVVLKKSTIRGIFDYPPDQLVFANIVEHPEYGTLLKTDGVTTCDSILDFAGFKFIASDTLGTNAVGVRILVTKLDLARIGVVRDRDSINITPARDNPNARTVMKYNAQKEIAHSRTKEIYDVSSCTGEAVAIVVDQPCSSPQQFQTCATNSPVIKLYDGINESGSPDAQLEWDNNGGCGEIYGGMSEGGSTYISFPPNWPPPIERGQGSYWGLPFIINFCSKDGYVSLNLDEIHGVVVTGVCTSMLQGQSYDRWADVPVDKRCAVSKAFSREVRALTSGLATTRLNMSDYYSYYAIKIHEYYHAIKLKDYVKETASKMKRYLLKVSVAKHLTVDEAKCLTASDIESVLGYDEIAYLMKLNSIKNYLVTVNYTTDEISARRMQAEVLNNIDNGCPSN